MPRRVYITVDDGPLVGTSNILSIVLELGVKITMLLVGLHVEAGSESAEIFTEVMANENILVGNHSYSHAKGRYVRYYKNPHNVLKDFDHNADILGVDNKIARLPGRNMWEVGSHSQYDIHSGKSAAQLLHDNGYTVFGWDVEWQHKDGDPIQSVETMLHEIESRLTSGNTFTRDHLVLLVHDQMFGTDESREQFAELIRGLDEQYELDDLSSYPID